MLTRGQHLPRDPDILVGMVLERDAEIERLKGMLKAATAQPFGQKSEKSVTVLEGQIRLDLGDAELDVEVGAADDEPKPTKAPRRQVT
jgi:transposase